MAETKDFDEMFVKLKTVLETYAPSCNVTTDKADSYYLDTKHIQENKKPLFFGATIIKKNYVSYYLMPIYMKPELLDDVPEQLKKSLKGKSCFNFKSLDDNVLSALKSLTKSGMSFYKESGYLN